LSLLLHLAWLYVMSLWVIAHGDGIVSALIAALIPWFVLFVLCSVGTLSFAGYVVAACLRRMPRTTR